MILASAAKSGVRMPATEAAAAVNAAEAATGIEEDVSAVIRWIQQAA